MMVGVQREPEQHLEKRKVITDVNNAVRVSVAARVFLALKEDRNLPPAQSGALPRWPLLASRLSEQG